MRKCEVCKGPLIELQRGSCGGRGCTVGCSKCKITYVQRTGGFVPTPGGETWGRSMFPFDAFDAPDPADDFRRWKWVRNIEPSAFDEIVRSDPSFYGCLGRPEKVETAEQVVRGLYMPIDWEDPKTS